MARPCAKSLQAALLGGSPEAGAELSRVMGELENTMAADVVVDPGTNATASVTAFLNGGFPHYVMVPKPVVEVEQVFARDVSADSELGQEEAEGPGLAEAEAAAAEAGAPKAAAADEAGADDAGGDEVGAAEEEDAAAPAPGPEEAEAAGPTMIRELMGVHSEPDLGRSWPTRVVMVSSVYDEWDADEEIPVWANNSADPTTYPDEAPRAVGYTVAPMYQRRHPERPGYVPNHGYEGGAYLKFIVD